MAAAAHLESPERDTIIRAAYESGDSRLLQSSIYAMGRSSSLDWLPGLVRETGHDDDAIRYEAAVACGRLGDESVVPHLITLVQDEDQQVQLVAAEALGEVGGLLAKRALNRCLEMGDESLELAARQALGNLEFDDDPPGLALRRLARRYLPQSTRRTQRSKTNPLRC
jgi:HEAT repeat protein